MDKRTDLAFRTMCSGIPINIMDISKVFDEGRRIQQTTTDDDVLRAGVLMFVRKLAGVSP
jgi:hypothetical protein